ncbi:superoxide dismutase [Photobacterium sanguinicancri]|uniref:superoxide dismutase n=1 Tax=Photobacterium sanguinicancri TaxID=875932 RepID=UPI000789A372|nr:superoxide dismutase [Photobacterium sanguinicancri]KXI22226.1 superoxide dismutase [Photobacterium sanguinicancri]
MSFTFPALPYAYDALEPYIDARTMEIHHARHHRTYFDKFMAAINGTELETQSLPEIFAKVSQYSPAVRNHGGGYYNHNLYWACMSPQGGGMPSGLLAEAINCHFGSFSDFKSAFSIAAANHFGSGFIWLSVVEGRLEISTTSNQDNPLMDVESVQGIPVLALDVWEHAYYISYQNKRPEYIDAWWHVVDWDQVQQHYLDALHSA